MKRRWLWALAAILVVIAAAFLLWAADDPLGRFLRGSGDNTRDVFRELVGFDLPADATVVEFKNHSGIPKSNLAWHIRPGASSLKVLIDANGFNPNSEMLPEIGDELVTYFPDLNTSGLGSPWHRDIGTHGVVFVEDRTDGSIYVLAFGY